MVKSDNAMFRNTCQNHGINVVVGFWNLCTFTEQEQVDPSVGWWGR